jgi:hypothetical protein
VTLPGAAGRVTAADCEAGSAVAGGAVRLPSSGGGSGGDETKRNWNCTKLSFVSFN